jgi:hypothetical protein
MRLPRTRGQPSPDFKDPQRNSIVDERRGRQAELVPVRLSLRPRHRDWDSFKTAIYFNCGGLDLSSNPLRTSKRPFNIL